MKAPKSYKNNNIIPKVVKMCNDVINVTFVFSLSISADLGADVDVDVITSSTRVIIFSHHILLTADALKFQATRKKDIERKET